MYIAVILLYCVVRITALLQYCAVYIALLLSSYCYTLKVHKTIKKITKYMFNLLMHKHRYGLIELFCEVRSRPGEKRVIQVSMLALKGLADWL